MYKIKELLFFCTLSCKVIYFCFNEFYRFIISLKSYRGEPRHKFSDLLEKFLYVLRTEQYYNKKALDEHADWYFSHLIGESIGLYIQSEPGFGIATRSIECATEFIQTPHQPLRRYENGQFYEFKYNTNYLPCYRVNLQDKILI